MGGFFMEKTTDIAQIIQRSIRSTFNKWEKSDMPYPPMTIKELARSTGISPTDILNCILDGGVQLPRGFQAKVKTVDTQRSADQIVRQIRTPQNSRYYQETAALILGEGQRYQRRFHLADANAKGKPTRVRINGRVGINQILNTKVVFTAKESVAAIKREEVKRKQEQRAVKKLVETGERLPTNLVTKVLALFESYSVIPGTLTPEVREKVEKAVAKGVFEFVQFTCPPVDAKILTSDTPEDYLLTNPKGNNFEGTAGRLQSLIRQLKQVGIAAKVSLIIGDNDEPEYIFPIIGFPPLNESLIEKRKKTYKEEFERDMKRKYSDLALSIYRISELEKLVDLSHFTYTGVVEEDVCSEAERMRDFFGVNSYYDGLSAPTQQQLVEMTNLKAQVYAKQGYILSTLFPEALLLQNEFPLQIRSRMLQASNSRNPLPILYPYGRSTSLY